VVEVVAKLKLGVAGCVGGEGILIGRAGLSGRWRGECFADGGVNGERRVSE
jgi:hypothetical protein